MLIRQFTTDLLAVLATSPGVATRVSPRVEKVCEALTERLDEGPGHPVHSGAKFKQSIHAAGDPGNHRGFTVR